MRIESVAVEPFALDLATPLQTAGGTIESREGFLIRIENNDEVGLGEATPLPGWTESHSDCQDALEGAAEVLAEDGADVALSDLDDTPAARHGVSLALADLETKREEVPLYRHLGGDPSIESVPVNATIGDGSPVETAGQARTAVDAGFECLKAKVGVRGADEDADRLAAIREAVGSDVELRADANGAWNRKQARRAFEVFEDFGISYVEQPLESGDLRGHADLRGGNVGVALDESLTDLSLPEVLAADAADVLVLKPMVLGGIDRVRSAAIRASDAGVTPVVTTTIDAVVARTAAVHLAASLPEAVTCGLATADLLASDLAPDPAPVADGRIAVPQGTGLGVGLPREGR